MQHNAPVTGYYEPSLSTRFLPGCPHCGTKHPLAFDPPLPADMCPGCEWPAQPAGEAIVNPNISPGLRIRVGNALMRVGAALHRLSRRLEP